MGFWCEGLKIGVDMISVMVADCGLWVCWV